MIDYRNINEYAKLAKKSKKYFNILFKEVVKYLRMICNQYFPMIQYDDREDLIQSYIVNNFDKAINSFDKSKSNFLSYIKQIFIYKVIDYFQSCKKQDIPMGDNVVGIECGDNEEMYSTKRLDRINYVNYLTKKNHIVNMNDLLNHFKLLVKQIQPKNYQVVFLINLDANVNFAYLCKTYLNISTSNLAICKKRAVSKLKNKYENDYCFNMPNIISLKDICILIKNEDFIDYSFINKVKNKKIKKVLECIFFKQELMGIPYKIIEKTHKKINLNYQEKDELWNILIKNIKIKEDKDVLR